MWVRQKLNDINCNNDNGGSWKSTFSKVISTIEPALSGAGTASMFYYIPQLLVSFFKVDLDEKLDEAPISLQVCILVGLVVTSGLYTRSYYKAANELEKLYKDVETLKTHNKTRGEQFTLLATELEQLKKRVNARPDSRSKDDSTITYSNKARAKNNLFPPVNSTINNSDETSPLLPKKTVGYQAV